MRLNDWINGFEKKAGKNSIKKIAGCK